MASCSGEAGKEGQEVCDERVNVVFHEAAVGILTLPSWLVKGVNTKLSLFVISQHLSEGSNATPCAKLLRIFYIFISLVVMIKVERGSRRVQSYVRTHLLSHNYFFTSPS